MTEVRIFELLQEIYNKKCIGGRISNENVQAFSKWASELVYETQASRSTSDINKRLNAIKLIREWGTSWCSYYKITTSNYSCFVQCLNDNIAAHDEIKSNHNGFIYNTNEVDESFIKGCTRSLYNEINDFNTKKWQTLTKRVNLKSFMQNWDNTLLNGSKFCVPIRKTCANYLKQPVDGLLENAAASKEDVITINDGTQSTKYDPLLTDDLRNVQVDAVRSLLNLNKTCDDLVLVETILKKIAGYQCLTHREIDLVWELWSKSNTGVTDKVLLGNFRFIYEHIGMGICRRLLEDASCVTSDDADIARLKASVHDDNEGRLRLDIDNMFYELFACSSYNKNVLRVFDLLK